MAEAAISLRLTLHRATDPISGSLDDDHGHTQAFDGWMGLAVALEALIDAAHPRQPTAQEDSEISDLRSADHDRREHP